MLFGRERPGENVVLRGARVVDPAEGIDATLDVRIDDGVITAVAQQVDAGDHRVVDATALVLAGLVALFYVVTIAKLGSNVAHGGM